MTIGVSGRAPEVSRTELRRWVRTVLQHLNQTQAELSLALVTDPEIHDLNRRYRGKDRPTDVLSFPLADALQSSLLGEVVISVETAARQAQPYRARRRVAERVAPAIGLPVPHPLPACHRALPQRRAAVAG